MKRFDRRQFLQWAGVGGAVFVSALGVAVRAADAPVEAACDDFFFVQLSDSHWGFEGAIPVPSWATSNWPGWQMI